MKRFGTGLVVGKFAPLHRGHQLVLDEAGRHCDRLVVLSWAVPDWPGCGPGRREAWLKALYPRALSVVLDAGRLAARCHAAGREPVPLPADDAPDDAQRAFTGWCLRELLGVRVDAVFSSEAYGDGLAAALAAMQGGAVVHVEVDRARARCPVSGTQVRRDPHGWRSWLHPRVYADFVERVALLGGESTGKTTLAQALAERLGTCWVAEVGRERWEEVGGRLAFPDMLAIAQAQVAREEQAAQAAVRYLVCDTTPMTTLFYSLALFGRADPRLLQLAGRGYHHTWLCDADFAFVQDGTRRTAEFRREQQDWYIARLAERGIGYGVARGSPAVRVEAIHGALAGFKDRSPSPAGPAPGSP